MTHPFVQCLQFWAVTLDALVIQDLCWRFDRWMDRAEAEL